MASSCTELTDELVRGRVAVRDDLKQPAGLVHGGVYAAIAESLASFGTAFAVIAVRASWPPGCRTRRASCVRLPRA